jgi:hypothetical protein
MTGPGVHLVVLVRRSLPKKSRDAAFEALLMTTTAPTWALGVLIARTRQADRK